LVPGFANSGAPCDQILVRVTIAVIINAVTDLVRNVTTRATGVQLAFINVPIAIVVQAIAELFFGVGANTHLFASDTGDGAGTAVVLTLTGYPLVDHPVAVIIEAITHLHNLGEALVNHLITVVVLAVTGLGDTFCYTLTRLLVALVAVNGCVAWIAVVCRAGFLANNVLRWIALKVLDALALRNKHGWLDTAIKAKLLLPDGV
jgi:hypothetical protein